MIINDGLRLWHVVQLKIATWNINCILEKIKILNIFLVVK
jgi:hypothetical protein